MDPLAEAYYFTTRNYQLINLLLPQLLFCLFVFVAAEVILEVGLLRGWPVFSACVW